MTFFHRCAFRQSPVKRLSRFIGKSNQLDISLKFQIPTTHLSVKCKVFVGQVHSIILQSLYQDPYYNSTLAFVLLYQH